MGSEEQMKLLYREPTVEMLEAGMRMDNVQPDSVYDIYQAMFDASPEIKIDMEPVAWILPTSPIRIVDHMNFNANYGGTVKPLYSTEQVATLQSKLDERDNTILEQQYQLNIAFSMLEVQGVSKERAKYVSTGIHVLATRMKKEITALESALKAER